MDDTRAELLLRAVRDTLDSIVSPAVRDTLLREALTLAQLDGLPGEFERFLDFLMGPLQKTLERALGVELGRSVVIELERITESMAPADRHEAITGPPPGLAESILPPPPRPARGANAPTLPARAGRAPTSRDYPAGTASAFGILSSAPPPSARGTRRLPVVFVATRDMELVGRFGAWLDPRAVVVRVSRLVDLLLDIQDAGDRRTVVVLDGHAAPIRAEALAAISDELPENVRIVLWGGSADYAARLSEMFPRVAEWLVCADDSSLADVAERCAEIVG
jgi:hypothetical protein